MAVDKHVFFKDVAKRLAASTLLYKVDSVVHVEDKDDIWFWEQLLLKYRPGRYKFKPATMNEKGNRTAGCAQCLKYKGFLSQKFFICIDSDLRRLAGEDISAVDGILQTYTYSWENHCAFAAKLQRSFTDYKQNGFDFTLFLEQYSAIVYEPFLLMLYQERNGLTSFNRDRFRQCISLQYRKEDEQSNGKQFLERLSFQLLEKTKDIIDNCGFDFNKESAYYATLGMKKENAYLYVRGHCLYNSLVSMGSKLCEDTAVDFEQNILKPVLAFEEYDEISEIKKDILLLKTLRKDLS